MRKFIKGTAVRSPTKKVQQANKILLSLKEKVSGMELPPLSEESMPTGVDLGLSESILVAHRLISKFTKPGNVTKCRDAAIISYFAYEEYLKTVPVIQNIWDGVDGFCYRKAHMMVQKAIKKVGEFSPLNISFSDCEFPKNSTYLKSDGEVSFEAKLNMKSHWTVTSEACPLAIRLIYNTMHLKRAAKNHMGLVTRAEKQYLFELYSGNQDIGLCVFAHLMVERVFTFVPGARAATVRKNEKTDRFINIEPMWNMILQRAFASWLRRLLSVLGNKIDPTFIDDQGKYRPITHESQRLHGLLLTLPDRVTVDFKNASDSTLKWAVKLICGDHIYESAMQLRSNKVVFGSSEYEPEKLSSMGNGFTFEIMTLVILVVSRVTDPTARVFGDDLILSARYDFNRTIGLLCSLGYQVNRDKTFLSGPFRESCGYFTFHDGLETQFLTSFDFTWCECYNDVIINANKIFTILEETKHLCPKLARYLRVAWFQLREVVSIFSRGHAPYNAVARRRYMSIYFFDYDRRIQRKQRKANKIVPAMYGWLKNHHRMEELCLSDTRYLEGCAIISVNMWLSARSKYSERSTQFSSALLTGFRPRSTVKGDGKWVSLPAFVTMSGEFVLFRSLRPKQSLTIEGQTDRSDPRGSHCR